MRLPIKLPFSFYGYGIRIIKITFIEKQKIFLLEI